MSENDMSTTFQALLQLASNVHDLMREHVEVNSRLLELYERPWFLRSLNYQDIVAQELRVSAELLGASKEVCTLKLQLACYDTCSKAEELQFADCLDALIVELRRAADLLVRILDDLNSHSVPQGWFTQLHVQDYLAATDKYTTAGAKLAAFLQALLAADVRKHV